MHQSLLTVHVPHNFSFFQYYTNRIYYKAISTNQCLVLYLQQCFDISYWYQKSNMFDLNTTTQLLANLKHTPSVLKPNIFLQLQAIIYDNFLNLSEKFLDMHSTFHLQFKIGDLIEELLYNWSHEKYRIKKESFRKRNDCLVFDKIGLWNEANYFLKSRYSMKTLIPEKFFMTKLFLVMSSQFITTVLSPILFSHSSFSHLNNAQVSAFLPQLYQLIDLL